MYKGIELKSSFDISRILLDEFRLAVVPGLAFGNDDYIRISYATDENSIIEGLKRLIQLERDVNSVI